MIFAKDILPYCQSLEMVFQRIVVVTLIFIHHTDIVIGCGSEGMLCAEDFFPYCQSLEMELQCLVVFSFFTIQQADFVVASGDGCLLTKN